MSQKKHFLQNGLILDLHPITVNVIGAGGTGSHVMSMLAKIDNGLKRMNRKGLHVTLFDRDKVSESNVGRQLFSESDIGYYKSQILVDRCNRYYGTDWDFYPNKYPQRKFQPANIIISCVDNVNTRFEIHNTYSNYSKFVKEENAPHYYLDFGNSVMGGQVILGTFHDIKQPENTNSIGKLPTIIDTYLYIKDNNSRSCSSIEAFAEQDLFINMSLVPFAGSLLWNLLKNYNTIYRGFYLNLNELKTLPIII